MDERTKQALEASIAHWKRNVEATSPWRASVLAADCELCNTFVFGEDSCCNCPVAIKHRKLDCPNEYYEARKAFYLWRSHNCSREYWQSKAQAMLDYLISLRED